MLVIYSASAAWIGGFCVTYIPGSSYRCLDISLNLFQNCTIEWGFLLLEVTTAITTCQTLKMGFMCPAPPLVPLKELPLVAFHQIPLDVVENCLPFHCCLHSSQSQRCCHKQHALPFSQSCTVKCWGLYKAELRNLRNYAGLCINYVLV